jgi:hypothetical protein
MTKHFLALMRKNYINWRRNPCSAVCSLVCPGLLMLILVWLRTIISAKVFDSKTLFVLETPQFMVDMVDGQLDIASTQTRVGPFFDFYLLPTNVSNVSTSPYSPLNFDPETCWLNRSWTLPRVASS